MLKIKAEILQKLWETEQNYHVKIPLAIESGSRGWALPLLIRIMIAGSYMYIRRTGI